MKILNQFWSFLDRKQKFFFFIILSFSLIQTLLEMLGIAAAIPFVTYLLKPESFDEFIFFSNYLNFGSIDEKNVILILCIVFFFYFFD